MFKKININPKGKKVGDCVIRAIAYATKQDWDKVYNDLCALGFKKKMMPNDKRVYETYLASLGWQKIKQPRKRDNSKYLVKELIKELDYNEDCYDCGEVERSFGDRIVISVANHLTCIAKNDKGSFDLIDTWDCSQKSVGNYFVKEG